MNRDTKYTAKDLQKDLDEYQETYQAMTAIEQALVNDPALRETLDAIVTKTGTDTKGSAIGYLSRVTSDMFREIQRRQVLIDNIPVPTEYTNAFYRQTRLP